MDILAWSTGLLDETIRGIFKRALGTDDSALRIGPHSSISFEGNQALSLLIVGIMDGREKRIEIVLPQTETDKIKDYHDLMAYLGRIASFLRELLKPTSQPCFGSGLMKIVECGNRQADF